MNTQHTPGPWTFRKAVNNNFYIVENEKSKIRICETIGKDNNPKDEANALLISKAYLIPELEKELRETIIRIEYLIKEEQMSEEVRACLIAQIDGHIALLVKLESK